MTEGMTPDERAIYFQDPGYGRVSDLCISLGFGDASTASRSYNTLSQKTIDWRKNFIKRENLGKNFPITCEAPEAQKCAEEFLEANESLFSASDESRGAGWLSLPDDREKILETTAKLMCTQESMFRRNDEYLRRKRKEKVPVAQEASDSEPEAAPDPETDENTIRVVSVPPSGEGEETLEVDSVGMQRSIERHLEYTYPIGMVYEPVPPEWIFDSSRPWPNREQSFAFRYFHERNLYTTSKQDRTALKKFIQALEARLEIDNDANKENAIQHRCKQLVKELSHSWGEKGSKFLMKTPSGLVKTPQFENAWKFHRNSWIYQVHGGITDGVVELEQASSPSVKEEGGSRKRLHDVPPSPLRPVAGTEEESSNKRQRYNTVGSPESNSTPVGTPPTGHEDVITVQDPRSQNQTPVNGQTAPPNSQPPPQFTAVQTEAPRVSAFTPVNVLRSNAPQADWHRQSSRSSSLRPDEAVRPVNGNADNATRRLRDSLPGRTGSGSFSVMHLDPSRDPSRQTRSVSAAVASPYPNGMPGQPPAGFVSGGVPIQQPSQPQPHPHPQQQYHPHHQQHQPIKPMPMALPPNPHAHHHHHQERTHLPTSASTPDTKHPTHHDPKPPLSTPQQLYSQPLPSHSRRSTPTSTTTDSRRLVLILENPKHAPDHDNPLPLSTFRSLTQSQFFDLFCQRSGRSREETRYLTFKYNWGHRDSFTVKERGNEVEWEEILERVRDTWLMARDRYGRERVARFQVWVLGPDEEGDEW